MKPSLIAGILTLCSSTMVYANSGLWIYGINGRGNLIRTELGSTQIDTVLNTGLNVASGLTRGPGGTVFAMDALRGAYQIDPNSGSITNVFDFDAFDPNSSYPGLSAGLAYDGAANALYSLRGASIGYGSPDNHLYLIRMDLNNMIAEYTRTDVVVYGASATHNLQPNIAIRSDGAIVTALDPVGGVFDSRLVTIDPNTGDVSEFAMLPALNGLQVSGLSVLNGTAYISGVSGSTTLIYEVDLFSGSTTYVATVGTDLFGMVVNPTPTVLAPMAGMGLLASRRRRR